jgi:SAM-dependent methyltransferase
MTQTSPDPSSTTAHYDAAYYRWQRSIGEFGARAALYKFAPYILPTDRVVDFGCGGGFLLGAIECAERRGVEINPVARADAAARGLTIVRSSEQLPDEWADVIISDHALEHCAEPLAELRSLRAKLRPGGILVCCVPHESITWAYAKGDVNQHLYTWSPMSAGNLCSVAGFAVSAVTAHRTLWPPRAQLLYRLFGPALFRLLCFVYRQIRMALPRSLGADGELVVVARRPLERQPASVLE